MRTRPDVIATVELPSSRVAVDEGGYLTDPGAWSREFAAAVAAQEGIALEALHWEVLRFMREYHDAHGIAPDARFVMRYLGDELGLDKTGAKHRLFALFPYGYVRQACKMAGMRQPRAWSTG
ncbi:MAG: TusE/DsrC/DsvC family sulfur relay protein [Maritimibacter sp.]|nr:TusE/DsrC/DsvC family sulfur relay protein [Maritimibacter sp.]